MMKNKNLKTNIYFLAILVVNLLSVIAIMIILTRCQNEAFFELSDEIKRLQVIADIREDYYFQVLEAEITAYTSSKEECGRFYDGKTSENIDIKRFKKIFKNNLGIVAVDYEVIPKWSFVMIPDRGTFVACDVGGKIKGHRIDILMETKKEAFRWGRKKMKVLIIMQRKDSK